MVDLSVSKIVKLPSGVDIWKIPLDIPETEVRDRRLLLSPQECERADRYRFDRHRHYFITARATLRQILSRYVDLAPEKICFEVGDRGKPFLPHSCVRFNVSHSGNVAVVAIAIDREVGIDIEQVRSVEVEQLARRFFSHNEYAAICDLEASDRLAAFFAYWTCKEAYLKGTGEGLRGLSDIEICLTRKEPKIVRGDKNWQLQQLDIEEGYAAAVAIL